jgi:hypothetical protein
MRAGIGGVHAAQQKVTHRTLLGSLHCSYTGRLESGLIPALKDLQG